MARSSTTPRVEAPTPRGEVVAQVLSGVVIGAGAVYGAALSRRGLLVALVIVMIGVAYLLRNRRRVQWVARGVLVSGLSALVAVVAVLLTGHDLV
jgi:hypothetical protein